MLSRDKIYFYSLILLVLGLPLSPIITSISQFILLGNWLFDKNIGEKFKLLIKRKSLLIFLLLYFTHIIWLFNTSDFDYAVHDLKIKVPLLILPIIIATSKPIDFKQLKIILLFFSFANVLGTIASMLVYFISFNDVREISVFISHIRFSLFITLSIFSLYYILLKDKRCKYKYILYIGILWLIAFLFILQSFTGIIIFFIILLSILLHNALRSSKIKRYIYIFLFLLIPVSVSYYIIYNINDFYKVNEIDKNNIDYKTINGNTYVFNFGSKTIENHNYIDIYICEKELRESWNKISDLKYDSYNKDKLVTKYSLIRYLTSKGFRKDSVGVSKLSKTDIINIENGITNYKLTKKWSLYPRLYKLIWQIDIYLKTGKINGYTLIQRMEYFKTGISIFKDNKLLGVGTGDVEKEFKNMYTINNTKLKNEFRHRAHNQILTFLISFGILGFILVTIAIIYPIIIEKGFRSFLFSVFLFIILFSMINEDSLETQAGVTFFALFYSLFLFNKEIIKISDK